MKWRQPVAPLFALGKCTTDAGFSYEAGAGVSFSKIFMYAMINTS